MITQITKGIKKIIVFIRDRLGYGAKEFVNLMAKGAIDANDIIANGGGVYIN